MEIFSKRAKKTFNLNFIKMKKIFLLSVIILTSFSLTSWTNYNRTDSTNIFSKNILKFNYSNKMNLNGKIEKIYAEKANLYVYIIPMKKSKDVLLAIENNEGNLVPRMFLNIFGNKIVYKDVNNRKTTIEVFIDENHKVKDVKYFEKNDSKIGFAKSKGCLGGSTSACVQIAWTACQQDFWCALTCDVTGLACPASILAACVGACNFI